MHVLSFISTYFYFIFCFQVRLKRNLNFISTWDQISILFFFVGKNFFYSSENGPFFAYRRPAALWLQASWGVGIFYPTFLTCRNFTTSLQRIVNLQSIIYYKLNSEKLIRSKSFVVRIDTQRQSFKRNLHQKKTKYSLQQFLNGSLLKFRS